MPTLRRARVVGGDVDGAARWNRRRPRSMEAAARPHRRRAAGAARPRHRGWHAPADQRGRPLPGQPRPPSPSPRPVALNPLEPRLAPRASSSRQRARPALAAPWCRSSRCRGDGRPARPAPPVEGGRRVRPVRYGRWPARGYLVAGASRCRAAVRMAAWPCCSATCAGGLAPQLAGVPAPAAAEKERGEGKAIIDRRSTVKRRAARRRMVVETRNRRRIAEARRSESDEESGRQGVGRRVESREECARNDGDKQPLEVRDGKAEEGRVAGAGARRKNSVLQPAPTRASTSTRRPTTMRAYLSGRRLRRNRRSTGAQLAPVADRRAGDRVDDRAGDLRRRPRRPLPTIARETDKGKGNAVERRGAGWTRKGKGKGNAMRRRRTRRRTVGRTVAGL